MKNLSKKQKIILSLSIVFFLCMTFFWGVRPNNSNDKISRQKVAELKEQENKDLHSIHNKKDKNIEKKEDKNFQKNNISSKEKPSKSEKDANNINKEQFDKNIGKKIQQKPVNTKIKQDNNKNEISKNNEDLAKSKTQIKTKSKIETKNSKLEGLNNNKLNNNVDKTKTFTATLTIKCDTILQNMDSFNKDKLEVLPADGIIISKEKVDFYSGQSVYDVLKNETKKRKIHMESTFTPLYNSAYINGINNIYEFDCGELSGWLYRVNGKFPNYGCSKYILKNGDVIEFLYTCNLGKDVGSNTDI